MAVGEGGSKNVIYLFFLIFYIALRIHGWIFPEKVEHRRVLPNENHKRLPNCTKSRSFVEGLG